MTQERQSHSEPDGTLPTDPTDLMCIQVVELVTEYLDGALEPEARLRLERHLAACDPCVVYIEQIRGTIAAAGRIEPEAVPPATMDRLLGVYREFVKS